MKFKALTKVPELLRSTPNYMVRMTMICCFIILSGSLSAQQEQPIPEVEVDINLTVLKDKLPFDTNFLLSGTIDKSVKKVVVKVTVGGTARTPVTWTRSAQNKEGTKFTVLINYLPPNEDITIEIDTNATLSSSSPFLQMVERKFKKDFQDWTRTPDWPGTKAWQGDFLQYITDNRPAEVTAVAWPSNNGLLDPAVAEASATFWTDLKTIFDERKNRSDGITAFNGDYPSLANTLQGSRNLKNDLNDVYVGVTSRAWGDRFAGELLELMKFSIMDPKLPDQMAYGLRGLDDTQPLPDDEVDNLNDCWDSGVVGSRKGELTALLEYAKVKQKAVSDIHFFEQNTDPGSSILAKIENIQDNLSTLVSVLEKQIRQLNRIENAIKKFDEISDRHMESITYEMVNGAILIRGTTAVNDLESAANNHVSLDFGLAGLARDDSEGNADPQYELYSGVNIYFRPVNRAVLLRSFGKIWDWNRLKRSLSMTIGVTLNDIDVENQRKGLIGDKGLLVGAGVHPARAVKLGAGLMMFRRNDYDPIVNNYSLAAQFYVSVSIDADVFGALGDLKTKIGF